jgi:hypothetical protein
MRQNEQLQRRAVFRPSLSRTVKRTAPQWQAAWSGREKSRLVLSMVVSIKGSFVASAESTASNIGQIRLKRLCIKRKQL